MSINLKHQTTGMERLISENEFYGLIMKKKMYITNEIQILLSWIPCISNIVFTTNYIDGRSHIDVRIVKSYGIEFDISMDNLYVEDLLYNYVKDNYLDECK